MPDFSHSDDALQLLHALQIAPRAPWAQLAPALDTDASTLSRRWNRIAAAGDAWLTSQPGYRSGWYYSAPYGSTAYVEVTCEAGYRDSVIHTLSQIPSIWTIECTSGSRDLLLTITTSSWSALDQLIRETLGRVDGIIRTVTNPLRNFFVQPGDWRLGALTPQQEEAIVTAVRGDAPRPARQPGPPSPFEQAIVRALAKDARAPLSQVAAATGRSVSGVSRAIHHMDAAGLVSYRLDFNQQRFGYSYLASLWVQAPQGQLDAIGSLLRRYRHTVREAVSMVGRANLYIHMWVQRMEAVDVVEEQLTQRFPGTRILDRWLATRFAKRAGHLIDPSGKHAGFVQSLEEVNVAQ